MPTVAPGHVADLALQHRRAYRGEHLNEPSAIVRQRLDSSARAVRGFAAWPGATGCTITATSSYLLGVSSTTADRILGTAPDPAATPGQLNHPECCGLTPAQKAAAPSRHIVDATDLETPAHGETSASATGA